MPRSRSRHKHHHHQQHRHSHQHSSPAAHAVTHKPKRRSAVPIMIAFIALLGVVIAFISAGTDITWLIAAAIAGGITGYFLGKGMDKVAARDSK